MYKKNKMNAVVFAIAVILVLVSSVQGINSAGVGSVTVGPADVMGINKGISLLDLDATVDNESYILGTPVISVNTDDNVKETVETSDSSVDWWPMFQHDPENTGYSTSTAPDTGHLLWNYTTEGAEMFSSPAVVDGKVFFGDSGKNMFYCIDESDGSLVWTYRTDGDSRVLVPPAVVDGRVFIHSYDGKVYCLNASDGSFIWKVSLCENPDYRHVSSPNVVNGRVFVGSAHGWVHCLNASDGSLIWRYLAGHGVKSSPVVADGKVYISAMYRNVYCLDAKSGSKIWRYSDIGLIIFASPSVGYGKVFIGSEDGNLYCLDATNGSLIWKYDTGSKVNTCPAVAYEKVFVTSGSRIHCLNELDGSLIWVWDTRSRALCPAVADGKVFIRATNVIYCLNASDGSSIWRLDTDPVFKPGQSLAVANGKIFIGGGNSNDNILYCFGRADHDVGVVDIDSIASGTARVFTPELTVKNFGPNNETDVPVNMIIARWEPPHPIIEYNKTINVDIDAGEAIDLVFPDWTPENLYGNPCSIKYTVTACTQLINDEEPDNDCETICIALDYLHDVGVKEITEPSSGRFCDGEWIHFDDGINYGGVGTSDGSTFEAAIRITPVELVGYDNYEITSVKFHYNGGITHSGDIKIYEDGTSTHPGALITSEPYNVNGDGWFEIPLSNPVLLDASEDIWVSVEISGIWPMGVDNGPAVDGKGDWIYFSGGWVELQDYGLDNNWNLWAGVEEPDVWPPGTYPVEGVVKNYGSYNESNFNVNATIYKVTDVDEVFYYDDFMVTTTMYPCDEIVVNFKDVTFGDQDGGMYRLEVTTEIIGDNNIDNDKRIKVFGIEGFSDTIPPNITLKKYNIGLLRFKFIANVSDPDPSSGIDRVEFYFDGELKKTVTEEPNVTNGSYEWICVRCGNHTVTATVYDNAGNNASTSISTPHSQSQSTLFQLLDRFIQRFPTLERIFSYFLG